MPKRKGPRLTMKKKHKKPTSPTPWVKHIRKSMNTYNLTYKQATRDGRVRNLYYLGRERP